MTCVQTYVHFSSAVREARRMISFRDRDVIIVRTEDGGYLPLWSGLGADPPAWEPIVAVIPYTSGNVRRVRR